MLPVSGTASGVVDLTIDSETGVYFTSLFFGETPDATLVTNLQGGSNNFSSIEFQKGATFSGGSMIVGSTSPSGVLQSVDLSNLTVIVGYSSPPLESDNVEDFS